MVFTSTINNSCKNKIKLCGRWAESEGCWTLISFRSFQRRSALCIITERNSKIPSIVQCVILVPRKILYISWCTIVPYLWSNNVLQCKVVKGSNWKSVGTTKNITEQVSNYLFFFLRNFSLNLTNFVNYRMKSQRKSIWNV